MADTDNQTGAAVAKTGSWMGDVQRALAIMLVGTLCICIIVVTGRVVISGDLPTLADMAKTLQAALVNMGLIGLGFFFGNTIAKMQQDTSQQLLTDKLTSTAPGTLPPQPSGQPAVTTVLVVPWWSQMTDAEKAAVAELAKTDPAAAAFMAAAQTGKATADDLGDLVAKGVLTQARADALKAI